MRNTTLGSRGDAEALGDAESIKALECHAVTIQNSFLNLYSKGFARAAPSASPGVSAPPRELNVKEREC